MNIEMEESSPKEHIKLKDIAALLLSQKKFLLYFIGIFTGIAFLYSLICPREFEAYTSLMPPEKSSSPGISSMLSSFSGGGFSFSNLDQSTKTVLYSEMIKSRQVASFIAEKLNLKEHRLFKSLNRDKMLYEILALLNVSNNRSGIIYIAVSLKTSFFANEKEKRETAKLAADIANYAYIALDSINRNISSAKATQKKGFIEKVLKEKQFELDSVDKALENFQSQNKVLALDKQTQAIVTNAITIGSELAKAEIELNLMLQEYEPNSPAARIQKEKVANLRSQYNRIQSGGLTTSDEFSIPLQSIPNIIREYTNLLRQQKILEQVNIYLETQKYQEAIQAQSDVSIIEQLDIAEPAIEPASPRISISTILGFFLSIFIAFDIVMLKSIIKSK